MVRRYIRNIHFPSNHNVHGNVGGANAKDKNPLMGVSGIIFRGVRLQHRSGNLCAFLLKVAVPSLLGQG
ncbi:MAG: hypothetical protein ACI9XK_003986 [Granulosicoccus sp.]|jgi:hypothetical protein